MVHLLHSLFKGYWQIVSDPRHNPLSKCQCDGLYPRYGQHTLPLAGAKETDEADVTANDDRVGLSDDTGKNGIAKL